MAEIEKVYEDEVIKVENLIEDIENRPNDKVERIFAYRRLDGFGQVVLGKRELAAYYYQFGVEDVDKRCRVLAQFLPDFFKNLDAQRVFLVDGIDDVVECNIFAGIYAVG